MSQPNSKIRPSPLVLLSTLFLVAVGQGKAVSLLKPTAERERGSSIEIEVITGGLPPGVANRLSHPHYWAPFILIGNGL